MLEVSELESIILHIQARLEGSKDFTLEIPRDLALDIQRILHEQKEYAEGQYGAAVMAPRPVLHSSMEDYLKELDWRVNFKRWRKGAEETAKYYRKFENLLESLKKLLSVPRRRLEGILNNLKFWLLIRCQYKI